MRFKLPGGRVVTADQTFSLDIPVVVAGEEATEVQTIEFRGGVASLTQEERDAYGIEDVVEQPMPDTRYFSSTEDPENPGSWLSTPVDPEALKQGLIAYAALARWRREVGGIDFNGVPIATDDRSKIMITGARFASERKENWTTEWAVNGTTMTVDAPTIAAISDAVEEHVNDCFRTYRDIVEAINLGSVATYEEVDAAFPIETITPAGGGGDPPAPEEQEE